MRQCALSQLEAQNGSFRIRCSRVKARLIQWRSVRIYSSIAMTGNIKRWALSKEATPHNSLCRTELPYPTKTQLVASNSELLYGVFQVLSSCTGGWYRKRMVSCDGASSAEASRLLKRITTDSIQLLFTKGLGASVDSAFLIRAHHLLVSNRCLGILWVCVTEVPSSSVTSMVRTQAVPTHQTPNDQWLWNW